VRDRLVLCSPVCVSEGCDFGRVKRELDEGFDFCVIAAGERNAEVGSSFEMANGVFNSVNVPGRALVVELRDDIGDGGEIWAHLTAEPVEIANILLKEFVKLLSFLGGHINIRDGVNWMTTAVGGWFGCGSSRVELCCHNEFESIVMLTHVNGDVIVRILSTIKINP